MKKILDLLSAEVAKAFAAAGYDEKYARVSISNRPDLCEYQCNGAMAASERVPQSADYDCKCESWMQLAGSARYLQRLQAVNAGIY